ncbi:hypothetical protein H4582DRAFT_1954147 [Lactarius indigo]|nr:hypothetical protein H4582DRAFT_1954147 [Lactarius indigo]
MCLATGHWHDLHRTWEVCEHDTRSLILRKNKASSVTCRVANASGSTTDNTCSVPSCVLSGLPVRSPTSPNIIILHSCDSTPTMPHTLLVSFSLLALVVTARPIAPVSEYSQPVEVQNAVKAIFEERTKQSDVDILSFAQDEIDVRLISDEGQQAVLSQLDGSAIKALVPLEGTENGVLSEVQRLREMLGSSEHLDDIEGAPEAELTVVDELPEDAAEVSEPSVVVSAPPSPWEAAQVLTRLSFTSLLAVYTVISIAAVLYAFYLIRGFLPQDQDQDQEKQASFADVESGYADEKCSIMQEKAPALVTATVNELPLGVLVDIDTDASVAGDEFHDAIDSDSRTSTPRAVPSGLPPVVAEPWLVPLPPSPTSSPLRRVVQLHGDAPVEGTLPPAWAMMVPDEQPRTGAHTGNAAAAAVDLALAMQLRTGVGMTADAAWLMRFVMALFGWVAVLVGGSGERQAAGGRRLLGW